ncbi:MAG: hypothetical protein HQ559_06210, partial [Lentisphaerae bacterium]|nr:hypothetical protein [Lentisphaerota bacterium]
AQLGRWVLGSEGAVYLRELAFYPDIPGTLRHAWLGESMDGTIHTLREGTSLRLYQDSSGGDRWNHVNHVDRNNEVPVTFRGYRVYEDDAVVAEGLRAQPWLVAEADDGGVAVTAPAFWQNFPGALGIDGKGAVRLALWPGEWRGPHEIQGGEEKTREIVMARSTTSEVDALPQLIREQLLPVHANAPAEWYTESGVFGPCTPRNDESVPAYEKAVLGAIRDPDRNLFTQLEVIDEYGWRNHGDTWADHEGDQTGNAPGKPALSHYNNEYDFGYGMLVQAARNWNIDNGAADTWFDLGVSALWHEADIDTYHTLLDEHGGGVYNGAQFTHTAHGVPAGRSSHRSYPEDEVWGSLDWPWGRGGGPEDGHFHTRGLVIGYLLTGESRLKEAAMEVARLVQWKVENDEFAQIANCSREAGNVIQVLTDAYELTRDKRYRVAVEKTLWVSSFKALSKEGQPPVLGFWSLGIYMKAAVRWLDLVADIDGSRDVDTEESLRQYAVEMAEYWVEGGFSYQKGGKPMGETHWNLSGADVLLCGARFARDEEERRRLCELADDAFETAVSWQEEFPHPKYRGCKPCTILCGQGHMAVHRHVTGGSTVSL